MTLGNTTLVEHGIQTEKSDLRAHVCVNARRVYVFPSSMAADLIETNGQKYKRAPAFTTINGSSLRTAEGYIIPWRDIPYIREVNATSVIEHIIKTSGFGENESTSEKGNKAVAVVARLLQIGHFPLPMDPLIVRDVDMQREGDDIIVQSRHRIEVKCDFRGGGTWQRGSNVTGNLFLQVAECNPLRMY